MNRTLSSGWTFLYKYLFPVVWIAGFAIGARLAVYDGGASIPDGWRDGAPPDVLWILLLVGLVGVALAVWFTAPLKSVRVGDDGDLVVSNYLKEWRIPVSMITEVKQNRWLKMRPITVQLRADMGCGTRVVFMPPWRFRLLFWHEDPEVEELRELAGIRAPS